MTDRLSGRYRLDDLLGHGAFATVHRAHDEQLDDWVAVKILAHNHAADPEMRGRFVAEGQVLRRLISPHLVSVHDLAATDDGRPYLVLELCDRGTLRHRVQQLRDSGWQPADADAIALATPLAAAITTMDDADVVHRDLTPANILLTTRPPRTSPAAPSPLVTDEERLVVTDLGFCKDLAASTGITASGGTDGFRPPEQQVPGAAVDVRADLWAASAVLCWALTGEVADNPRRASASLRAAGVSDPVADGIAAGLAPDPDARPATPATWLDGITRNATMPSRPAVAGTAAGTPETGGDPTDRSPARAPATIAAVVCVLAVVGALQLNGSASEAGPPPASVTQVDGATEPGPTPTPTPTGPPPGFEDRLGGEWSFHLTTGSGWEYDVEIGINFAYVIDKDITDSPPGSARLASALDGGAWGTYTPTVTDREAPPGQLDDVHVHFGVVDFPELIAVDPCGVEPVSYHPRADKRFVCLLSHNSHGGFTSVDHVDHSEPALDEMLATLETRSPQFYEATVAEDCRVVLHLDGTVSAWSEGQGCTISGDSVVPRPTTAGDAA